MNLLNFCINGTELEIAGQVFDLHNFHLQNYTHSTLSRTFKINLKGDSYFDNNQVMTDLTITFKNVSCLRIEDDPFDEENVCFLGMQQVSKLDCKPDMANRLEEQEVVVMPIAESGIQVAADRGKTTPIDWNTYLYIDFIWGVNILIAAETVEVSFHQAVSLVA